MARTSSKQSKKSPKKRKKSNPSAENICGICNKQLSSSAHLKRHQLTHRIKNFICDYEGRTFNTKDKLRLHILQHRKHYKVCCLVCQKSYTTNQSMRKHLRTHFENYQCDLCGRTFRHKRLMLNHVAAIHFDNMTVPCNYCTRLFPNTTTRDAHQKTIHQDQKVNTGFFKCPECPVGFEMKEELRLHSFIHFDGEIHTCLDCGQIFKLKKNLMNHAMKHETSKFMCKDCGQFFQYRSNLGKHLNKGRCKGQTGKKKLAESSPAEQAELAKQQLINMTVNPTRATVQKKPPSNIIAQARVKKEPTEVIEVIEKPLPKLIKKPKPRVKAKKSVPEVISSSNLYDCDLCDFACQKKCQMLSHIRQHIASQRHKCKICSETFSTQMRLHRHSMKSHGRGVIGSTEYSNVEECTVCHRKFSEKRLKFHLKLHDTPSFTCDKCTKSFRDQSALEKHQINAHRTDKIFTCATCGKSFKKMTILKHHEETHNPIKFYVQCEICNAMMQMKSIKLHMDIKHGDRYKEKKHVCDCGKAFRYEKQLDKHIKAVHERVSRGITYPCSDCSLVFNRRSELRLHSFEHYTGKLFECHCGMKFKKQKLLTIHSAVHKDKVWPCDLCTLTFKTRGGRRKHQAKAHDGNDKEFIEIPYEIKVLPEEFVPNDSEIVA